MTTAAPLWKPTSPQSTRTAKFRNHVNAKFKLELESYEQLWRWSCDHRADFWSELWDFEGVVGTKGSHVVDEAAKPADNPLWFQEAELNWAENQLRHAKTRPDAKALIQLGEPAGEDQAVERSLTYGELSAEVGRCQRAMQKAGVQKGDRVGYWGGNCCEAAIVLLATSSLGAIFSSAAADFGLQGVQERFEQIKPKVLFVTNSVVYAGVARPLMPLVTPLLKALSQPPTQTIAITHLPRNATPLEDGLTAWDDFMARGDGHEETTFVRGGFNDPIWVLFSSGTTGKPKAIVHRQGGMLLQALKEHSLCGDIGSDDVFFYYTTTGWMMYQYLISGLSTGATVVLYEGSPLKPVSAMFEITDRLGVTIFGTSAKWIEQISKHYPSPKDHHSLKTLKQILSTGSPLPPVLFDFVYSQIKQDVLLGSITGGTDICSLFAGHNTSLPVYRGEIQCRMLAQDIDAFSVEPNAPGELVCKQAFPVQPVGFWPLPGYGYPDEDVEGATKRYKESYFEGAEPSRGWWWHGDHVQCTASKDGNGGGVVMLGRSDGVLNPGGIRFGPTDIYSVLETSEFAASIDDALVVGQMIDGGADERVLLFVKLHNGTTLDAELVAKVKKSIRLGRSARHVPAKILAVKDIPATLNGKRVEVPIRKIINGSPASTINPATLRNPECLEEYVALGKELRVEVGM